MVLLEALQAEMNKENLLKILDYLGNDKSRFDILMQIFFTDGNATTQRAAWVMSHCAEKQTHLLEPYLEKMIRLLPTNQTDAVTRNIVRILQVMDIPNDLLGIAFESCYEFVAKVETPIAIKAFSMTILYNICKKEPDLKNEVIELIEMQMEHGSKGVVGRGKKVLSLLRRL